MSRSRKRYHRPGTAPGTLVPAEAPTTAKVRIRVLHYDEENLEERELASADECAAYRGSGGVTWINVDGLHDVSQLQKLGEIFGLHPLALEDVLNVGQRPKLDEYDEQQFIVMKDLGWDGHIRSEQMSFFLGADYVITLQEEPGDCFDPVRERLRKGKGRLRRCGADYLAYALVDALVDQAFPLLEKVGERIEELEAEVLENPSRETLLGIREVKHALLLIRRAAWPQREVIHAMQREDSRFVKKETRVYLRDLYDHTIQILDMIESYRDVTAGMLDVYLSSLSHRMNEVMKVLTIIATIFIPLTFVVGLYGMNFNTHASPWSMPELNWPFGYPLVLLVMLGMAAGMVLYFRRKGWF